MILTTEINTIDRGQISNNAVHQQFEDIFLFDNFSKSLEQFERRLYQVTFNKLLSISPAGRQENGISFIQSALFLYLALMAISTEVDHFTRVEIENCLNYEGSKINKMNILREIISWLPNSNRNMKFRWTFRLILNSETPVSQEFVEDSATVRLHVTHLNDTKHPDVISNTLNRIIEKDSGGTMHNTFEEDDMLKEICSILLTTMYIRPRWRSAPTVLNGTRAFYDTSESNQHPVRMIRINDVMQYAALDEWDSDAIEISYGIPNLTILLLVPRGYSLKNLTKIMTYTNIRDITTKMRKLRVAATLPIYTLRMTLLLPEKLKAMGMSRLTEINNSNRCNIIRLSHAVQRLMFWAEAGRNAFKDDGIEWDEAPDIEFVVNRPYLFYLRWKNITLINGNFVL
ncbi:serpin B10-like [Melitaea cinxia]|uniref:serpin B10-like n=1 Tax=Melitaea cinxia TaxID=113334 RepID=UPI001E26FFF2|nr:serpin B10-like [Melitaea cinxia]